MVRRVSKFGLPDLGVGVGFRLPHYRRVVETHPEMDWFEVISETFMVDGGSPVYHLDRLVEGYPVVPHGVSLSLGSEGDPEHLRRLVALCRRVRAPWASDHLCFSGNGGIHTHDLLPLPRTREVRDFVAGRIRAVSDALGIPFAIENPSSYVAHADDEMPEWAFLAEIAEAADCPILLDVNNIVVSGINHGFDPADYLAGIPAERVVQIHLAGHTTLPSGFRIDTHDHPVPDPVWALYAAAIRRIGPVSTLVEWDDHIPAWERLAEEAATARRIRAENAA
jgi:uncharacterized protein (UPF0276 family)